MITPPQVEVTNRRILIIDDNEAIHNDFRKILAEQQQNQAALRELEDLFFGEANTPSCSAYELDYADQGKTGFEKARQALGDGHPYAMAFVDMRMPPGWDGLETIERLWQVDQEIQIVICTAMSDYSWNDITKKLGKSDRLLILKKPFDNMEVLQLAHSLTSKWALTHRVAQQMAVLSGEVQARTIELKRNEAKLRHIVNAAPDAIITVDADGRMFEFNQAAEKLFRLTHSKAIGQSVLQLFPAGNPNPFLIEIERARSCQKKRDTTLIQTVEVMGSVEGVEFPMEASWNSYKDAEADHFILILRDIRKRKEEEQVRRMMEVELRQAQKLESIGQLAAGIAHEINTPTQYIGDNARFLLDAFGDLKKTLDMYAVLLQDAKANSLNQERLLELERFVQNADISNLSNDILQAIEQSLEGVGRVAKIVRAMKDFSHPGTNEKIPMDINRAIDSTITVARNEWKYVAEMVTQFDPDLQPAHCLPGEFNQVILNIIVNAAHAITDVVGGAANCKGTITVRTRQDGDWAEIHIGDTGTGIPEHARKKVFDPFFTTKEVGKGTGQGLAIAHSVVVDKHGGTIHFETESGKGTTFIIRIPINPKPAVKRPASTREEVVRHNTSNAMTSGPN